MARTSDLEKMSYAELTEMEARIERLKLEKQNSERAMVRKQLMEEPRQYATRALTRVARSHIAVR